MLKTPITYYGGKLNLVDKIVPLLDYTKKQFVSLFTGGGAVEFAKPRHDVEVWNDIDDRVITFWEVLQDDNLYPELEKIDKKYTTRRNISYKGARYINKFCKQIS